MLGLFLILLKSDLTVQIPARPWVDTVVDAPRGRALQTLVKVEQRNLLAERVAAEMQSRNDFARAPGVVRRFLSGPWSQVVAQASAGPSPAALPRKAQSP